MQTLQNETEICGGSTKGLRNRLHNKTGDTLCFLRAYNGHMWNQDSLRRNI